MGVLRCWQRGTEWSDLAGGGAEDQVSSGGDWYRGSRLCLQCAGQRNERTSTIAEAEVHAPDGVDAFAIESRCEVVRHVVTMTLSLFFRCRTVCSSCRLPLVRSARCLVVRAAG